MNIRASWWSWPKGQLAPAADDHHRHGGRPPVGCTNSVPQRTRVLLETVHPMR
jgi:hypothetical protein